MNDAEPTKQGLDDTPVKKRTAGFWSILFMVIGVQCGGVSTVWNIGATEGLKKLLLGHAIVGLMYVMLALCFAELTSVVPFAGGSFGFCRAALGPFWGFLVGASEVLENIMKVVVCLYLLSSACTLVFETKAHLAPIWMLICYMMLLGIHIRGGSLFWNSVNILGLISIGTVLMFCIGNTKDIDVQLYGQLDASTFDGHGQAFLESLYLPIWVYIGLEVVPQTCERVKNVHQNLPRALVLGTLFTYGCIFWAILATLCNYPGFLYPPAWINNPFPFTIGFVQMFDTPDFLFYGPLFAIIPLFASALTFMWGCGYQVASLARSGLLPSVFATTYGPNETPIVALVVSSLIQFPMCVGNQRINSVAGVKACYTAMMIGATFVYIGMFASFIVFRFRFSGMKRHWTSPLGVAGAVIGIGIATLLCIAVIVLQANYNSITTYFVYMGASAIYYAVYARHTQYFSKEEQKHFMKAYILNANKSKTKKTRSTTQKMIDAVLGVFSRPASLFVNSNAVGAGSSGSRQAGGSLARNSKQNSVAPAPVSTYTAQSSGKPPSATVSTAPDVMPSSNAAEKDQAVRCEETTGPAREAHRRLSWIATKSTKVGWSGKAMSMAESQKFLEVLISSPQDVAGQLAEVLPNQFVAVVKPSPDALLELGDTPSDFDAEVLLHEVIDGALDGDDSHDEAL